MFNGFSVPQLCRIICHPQGAGVTCRNLSIKIANSRSKASKVLTLTCTSPKCTLVRLRLVLKCLGHDMTKAELDEIGLTSC